jgi:superfamily I DNA and/or RNA helicase
VRAALYELVHGDDRSHIGAFREIEKQALDADGDFGLTMRGLIDLSIRRYAFQLAARWWEGEFIRRALKFRENADRIELWRLAACVTPCIVGTPDRFANVFTRWTRSGAKTMWGEADLIVVDEAGQASCDRAAAVFGYADRALVVGDVLQISPVEGEDAPMWGPALARRNNVFDEDAIDRGLLIGLAPESHSVASFGHPESAEGSVMRAASAASWAHSTHAVSLLGKGAWLLDHFRCRPGIIAYSNAGWYHGALSARRVVAAFPYPEFGHRDVREEGLASTSRRNMTEVRAAIDWIVREQGNILAATGESSIDRAIAVVTPFRDQAIAAKQALKSKLGVVGDRIICGTLHSLQGAERPIVIMLTAYSGAYFAGDGEMTHFLDRQGTLLNVAVSRARDAFIVFGDRRVFDRARRGTPTAALAPYFKVVA